MLETNPKGRSTTLFKALLGALLVGGTTLTAGSAQAGWTVNPPIGGAIGFTCVLGPLGPPNDCFQTPEGGEVSVT
jgi:hypothetical protein